MLVRSHRRAGVDQSQGSAAVVGGELSVFPHLGCQSTAVMTATAAAATAAAAVATERLQKQQ